MSLGNADTSRRVLLRDGLNDCVDAGTSCPLSDHVGCAESTCEFYSVLCALRSCVGEW